MKLLWIHCLITGHNNLHKSLKHFCLKLDTVCLVAKKQCWLNISEYVSITCFLKAYIQFNFCVLSQMVFSESHAE